MINSYVIYKWEVNVLFVQGLKIVMSYTRYQPKRSSNIGNRRGKERKAMMILPRTLKW